MGSGTAGCGGGAGALGGALGAGALGGGLGGVSGTLGCGLGVGSGTFGAGLLQPTSNIKARAIIMAVFIGFVPPINNLEPYSS